MTTSTFKRTISCFIATLVLCLSFATTAVSADNSIRDSDLYVSTYANDTVNTIKSFSSENAQHIYSVPFTTNSTLSLKLMLAAKYTDGSTGNFDVYVDGIYKTTITMDGSARAVSLGSISSGSHSLTLWPNEYNKTYVIVGQVYYLS